MYRNDELCLSSFSACQKLKNMCEERGVRFLYKKVTNYDGYWEKSLNIEKACYDKEIYTFYDYEKHYMTQKNIMKNINKHN